MERTPLVEQWGPEAEATIASNINTYNSEVENNVEDMPAKFEDVEALYFDTKAFFYEVRSLLWRCLPSAWEADLSLFQGPRQLRVVRYADK